MRRPVSRSTSRSRKREVEARVVRDEGGVAGEREQPAHRELGAAARRGARPGRMPVSEVTAGGSGTRGSTSVSNASSSSSAADALRADLADPRRARREPGRLEVDDDEVRVLEQDVRSRRRRETDGGAAPGEPRVAGDDVVEQRARERRRRAREREEHARRLLGRHGPAPGLDELDEPVGGIERELHGRRS